MRRVEIGKPPWHIEEMDVVRRVSPSRHIEKSERDVTGRVSPLRNKELMCQGWFPHPDTPENVNAT
jgi:hypothetical protein